MKNDKIVKTHEIDLKPIKSAQTCNWNNNFEKIDIEFKKTLK